MFKKKKRKLRLALSSTQTTSSSSSSSHSSPLNSLRQYFSPREEIPAVIATKRISMDFTLFCEFIFQLLCRQDIQGLTQALDMIYLQHKDIDYNVLWDYIYDVRELAYLQRNTVLEKALQEFEKTLKAERNRKRDNSLWSIIREDELPEKEEFVRLHKERMHKLYLQDLT